MGQGEGIHHVGAFAPGGGRTASHRVAPVPRHIKAGGLQALIHRSSAVNEGSLFRGTPMGAVPLTAVALETIPWQVLKIQNWAAIALAGVAAPEEVEDAVAVETSWACAARKIATASGVIFVLHASVGALQCHYLHALLSRVTALQALLPAPLTAQVRGGAGHTLKVSAPGQGWPSAPRSGSVAQVRRAHSLYKADDFGAHPVTHGPVCLLGMGTASGHQLQFVIFFPFSKDRGPA